MVGDGLDPPTGAGAGARPRVGRAGLSLVSAFASDVASPSPLLLLLL